MLTPASAIVWEIWRKNRWGFWFVLALLAGGLLIRLVGLISDTIMAMAGLSMGVSFLVTFAIFSFAASGPQISFPVRTFTLPVRTGFLVNCPICFGALAITMLHFAWAFLFFLPVGEHYPLWPFTIYWVAALITFQAIVWCLADYPKMLVVVLMLAIILFVSLAIALVEQNEAKQPAVYLLTILPVAYLSARLGIRQQRRGQWQALERAQALMDKATGALFRRQSPFATAARAQLWMEGRRNAVAPLISLGVGLAVASAGFVRLGYGDDIGLVAVGLFYTFCFLLTLWASISGLLLARDASSKSLSLSSFLATRPVTSGELALAKVKLACLVTVAGWLVYATGLFLWFHFCWRPVPLVTRQDESLFPTMAFVALALAWHLVGALPVWLTGRIESPAWAGLLLLGGYIALGNVLQFLDKHFGLLIALPWVFAFALAAKIWVAGWAFREANRRRLLSQRAIAKYVLFWFVGTICFVVIASAVCQRSIFPQPLASLAAALLLPLARVGLAPLALARSRHR